MKKSYFIKPLAMAMFAFTFGCSSSNEGTETTDPLDVETAGEAEIVGDLADVPVSNEISYADMFNNVEDTENYDILELARMDENLSTFVRLVELSGLDVSLEMATATDQIEAVTVLIPTNEAFQQMSEEQFEYLVDPANKAELIQVIKYHILPSEVPSIQFNSSQIIETQGDQVIEVTTDAAGNVVYIGGAEVVKADVEAANGIIHVVDAVVEPTEDTNLIR